MIRPTLLWALPALAQTTTQALTSADYVAHAVAHLASGQAQLAVDDYSQAIRLRLAQGRIGDFERAIQDFNAGWTATQRMSARFPFAELPIRSPAKTIRLLRTGSRW